LAGMACETGIRATIGHQEVTPLCHGVPISLAVCSAAIGGVRGACQLQGFQSRVT